MVFALARACRDSLDTERRHECVRHFVLVPASPQRLAFDVLAEASH